MTADETGNGADAPSETKSPEQIRADIEQTRDELGDTVEALAEKTDVKAQAKNRISAVKDAAQTKRDEYAAKAKQAAPDVSERRRRSAHLDGQREAVAVRRRRGVRDRAAIGWLLGRRQEG